MPVYGFGPFVLDTAERRLSRDGVAVALTGKPLEILEILAEARGRLVQRELLHARLWPDTVVEERTLTVHVSTLRRALSTEDDVPDAAEHVETVPRVGYRLTVPVKVLDPSPIAPSPIEDAPIEDAPIEDAASDRLQAAPPASTVPARRRLLPLVAAGLLAVLVVTAVLFHERAQDAMASGQGRSAITLAVLPFAALDLPADDRYLGLGIADAVITQLSGLPRLGVRPTSAVRGVAEDADTAAVGRSLLVANVLEGTVQRDGDRLRVSVRLVETESGTARWGDRFEQPLAQAFELQDAIARRVASSLLPQLAAEESALLDAYRPRSAEAYRLQLQGRVNLARFERDPAFKAVEQFQQAIALDPGYARAHSGLAVAYAQLTSTLVTRALSVDDGVRLSRESAERALALDPHLGEARAVLAGLRFNYDWDWAGAEQDYRRALASTPNHAETWAAYGWYLTAMGRSAEALDAMERARRLDPLRRDTVEMLGFAQWIAGDAERGLATLAEASALDPGARRPYFRRMLILDSLGRAEEAMAERVKWLERFNEVQWSRRLVERHRTKGYSAALGTWLAMLDRLGQPYEVAMQRMALGEPDAALAALQRCLDIRCASAAFLRVNPSFRPLHGDPRFEALVARLKLPEAGS